MRFRSQRVAYPYFVVAMLLFGLQMVFGLLAAAKYLGPDPLLNVLPFDVARAFDELTGMEHPRIWTAERDRELWQVLRG